MSERKPLTRDQAMAMVTGRKHIRVYSAAAGFPHLMDEGRVVAYAADPTVTVERPDGTQAQWQITLPIEVLDDAEVVDVEDERALQLSTAVDLLRDEVDDEPCRFDHHGDCQEHGSIRGTCRMARIKDLLDWCTPGGSGV